MFDFRDSKKINLLDCVRLSKESTAYLYTEPTTSKKYVVKYYQIDPEDEIYLISEFKKLVLLSAEQEIANVFGLVTIIENKNQYLGYIMDYVEGDNLADYLKSNSLSFYDYESFLVQLSQGLEKAHNHDVIHNDIRLENLIVNNRKRIKIIDFLWNDYGKTEFDKFQNDIIDFKKIEKRLFNEIEPPLKKRSKIIHDYCQSITDMNNVGNTIHQLKEISLDLSILRQESIEITSTILSTIPDHFDLHKVMKVQINSVPDSLNLDITEQEKIFAEENKSGKNKLRYDDSRAFRIQQHVYSYLMGKYFYALKQANLFNLIVNLENKGEEFYGPYSLIIEIELYSKALQWNEINSDICFLPKPANDLEKQLFEA